MSKNSTRKQLAESALKRAKANNNIDVFDKNSPLPPGAIMADHEALKHNNTYGPLPRFYKDELVICRDCGKEEVWTAKSQKWWYEEIKGNINTRAIFCKSCRKNKSAIKAEARKAHMDGIKNKRIKKP
ncbi:putative zinc ribbon protein [Alteromonadaceae bacterium 2753L.S.0a.02]|nr:putative zinc ribbon protein [Alteromonadaceae bacterium 2753L.S.0a.02]